MSGTGGAANVFVTCRRCGSLLMPGAPCSCTWNSWGPVWGTPWPNCPHPDSYFLGAPMAQTLPTPSIKCLLAFSKVLELMRYLVESGTADHPTTTAAVQHRIRLLGEAVELLNAPEVKEWKKAMEDLGL